MGSIFRQGHDDEGSVGIMFGFTATLLAAAIGGALDYTNAIKSRTNLQDVADASALAAARLGEGTSLAEYQKVVEDFFAGSETCDDGDCAVPTVTIGDNGAVRVEIAQDVPTYILSVIGMHKVPVSVAAEALPPIQFGVDVMMVLDYSGSMAWDDKYKSMASAAKEFIDRSDDRNGDTMRVGIVPFSEYVLTPLRGQYAYDVAGGVDLTGIDIIGCMLNRQAPFSTSIDTPTTAQSGSLWPVVSYTTGGADGASSYSDAYEVGIESGSITVDGITYTYEYYPLYPSNSSEQSPGMQILTGEDNKNYVSIDGYDKFAFRWLNGQWPAYAHSTYAWSNVPTGSFNGYGNSSSWDTPANGSLPSDFNEHQLSEALDGSCANYADKSVWARPLTNEFEKLKTSIDKMGPLGATNIALAMDFGWHYLSQNEPFTEASTEGDTKRAIVLLSDGTQTVAAHGESGAFNIDSANENIIKTCTAAKQAGVEVYTIAFGIKDQWTRDLIKGCSSGDPYYFEPSAGAQLEKVFDDIFEAIAPSKPRISM